MCEIASTCRAMRATGVPCEDECGLAARRGHARDAAYPCPADMRSKRDLRRWAQRSRDPLPDSADAVPSITARAGEPADAGAVWCGHARTVLFENARRRAAPTATSV